MNTNTCTLVGTGTYKYKCYAYSNPQEWVDSSIITIILNDVCWNQITKPTYSTLTYNQFSGGGA